MRLITAILGLFLVVEAQAQNLINAEPKTPYLLVQCESSLTDSIGALGLRINKISVTQTNETLLISANDSLLACTISTDGSKKVSWVQVNPFQGFEVQYYHYPTDSIQTRKFFMDPAKPYNRMKMSLLFYDSQLKASVAEATMKEDEKNSFSGTVEIKKSVLLSRRDLAQLDKGASIEKRIELYYGSNFTTYVNDQEDSTGDENRGAQNLILQFKKDDNQIRLVKILGLK